MTKFLLIAPKPPWDADFAGLRDADGMGVTRVAPIAIATVAAFAPPGIACVLHDESLDPIDFDSPADCVGITCNVAQARRALEIADEFRARGKTVVIGGPHVTLEPEVFAGRCDVAVIGEFESIATEFYDDLLNARLKPRYEGGRPELADSPIPAWELFDNDRALVGVAQTSRGCPFECNFCDVIQYIGRKQRRKSNEQVIAEVQRLYDFGYNIIQLADDNFTVYRRNAASLLEALAAWNGHDGRGYVKFGTQASVDIATDDHMLGLCANAGVTNLFFGVESVNEDSLRAAGKRQNLNADMVSRLSNVVSFGLEVVAGLMVGFDSDTVRIFEQQEAFGMSLPIGTFKISSLVAPAATPLFEELRQAGRLQLSDDQFPIGDMPTNFVPAQMSKHQLFVGTRWLISRLNRPEAFVHRLHTVAAVLGISRLRARAVPYVAPGRALSQRLFTRMMAGHARRDPAVARAIAETSQLMHRNPEIADGLEAMLYTWMLTFNGHFEKGAYDPDLAKLAAPPLEAYRVVA